MNNGLSLDQVSTVDKSSEITAIPQFPREIELTGATVTIDAVNLKNIRNFAAWDTDRRNSILGLA